MSDELNSSILQEIKRNNSFTQRRMSAYLAIIVMLFAAIVGSSIFRSMKSNSSEHASWDAALDLLDEGKPQEALTWGQKLIRTSENYYYAHSCLGDIYLANGNVKEALKEYETAYNLFPSDKIEADLKAINKRIEMESQTLTTGITSQ